MVQDVRFMNASATQTPPTSMVLATNGAIDPPSRGLYVAVEGTATLTDLEGNVSTGVPLVTGVIPGQFTAIASITSATIYILR